MSSDEDRCVSPTESSIGRNSRRRSSRACDQCRRTKSKCEPSTSGPAMPICRNCASLGIACTYAGPSHKRGPPKGYILALERRLHQVEALLGTIIGSEDPRARSLTQALARDQLASQIIRRVRIGPFGRGRLRQPFGSTKEDFLASIMTGTTDSLALVSPDGDWQNRLQGMLSPGNAPSLTHAARGAIEVHYGASSLPPTSNMPVAYQAKIESPTPSSTMISPLLQFHPANPFQTMSCINLDGLEKMDGEAYSPHAEESSVRVTQTHGGPSVADAGAGGFSAVPRCVDNAIPGEARRWYLAQEAVG